MGVHAERCRGQLLSGTRAATAEQVVEQLLAVQGQDPRGARLSVRARSTGLTAPDVDRALTEDRSLVITWLNRGTLHLVRSEDLPLLHTLTTPQLQTGNLRRLAQEGVVGHDVDRGVDLVVRALEGGPQTRPQLRDLFEAAGVPVAGQALVHVLMRTSLLGHVVRGPMVGSEHAYALVRDWLPQLPAAPTDRDAALVELATRYLRGHGPATAADLARWAGIPLGQARRGLAGVRGVRDRGDGLASLGPAPRAALPPPRLLGPFDPLLLGWADRSPVVGEYVQLVTSNGIFRPFALVEGRAVAAWSVTRGLEPFEDLGPARPALETELADVRRFLGGSRYR